MDEFPERFYMRLEIAFGYLLMVGIPAWLAVFVIRGGLSWSEAAVLGLVVRMFILLAIGLVFFGVVVAAFPTRLGPEGIRSYDFWGRYGNIRWDDIKRVDPRNYAGLRYLRIESAGGTYVLLPLWVRDRLRLLGRIRDLAGPESPLTQTLDLVTSRP